MKTEEQRKLVFLETISGPMFAGKTETLIRRIKRYHFAKRKYLVFKHSIDTRYSNKEIKTHYGLGIPSILINDLKQMLVHIEKENPEIIFIDEIQFFNNKNEIKILDEILAKNISICVAGLDLDFRGEAFGIMSELLAKSDFVKKIHSVCNVCGNLASRTQRLIEGKPANYNDDLILTAGEDKYEPRCRSCHIVRKNDDR